MRRRSPLRKCGGVAVLVALPLLIGYFAIQLAIDAWPLSAGSLWWQAPCLLFAAMLLSFAVAMVFIALRRKLTTGRFTLTAEEVLARRAEHRSRLGAGKPLWPQLWIWLVPSLLSGIVLSAGIGIVVATLRSKCVCSAFDWVVYFGLAAVLVFLGLIYPVTGIRRKLRTGFFLPTEEALEARRARAREPKTLQSRLLAAGIWWLCAVFWTMTAFGPHRSHSSAVKPWLLAGLMWLNAILWTWQVFRPTNPRCGLPVSDEASSGNGSEDPPQRTPI